MLPRFEQYLYEARSNKWFRLFTVFCRIVLALGFIPSGIVKVMGERFTALSSNHPLGQYFDALHHTGFYYTSLGIGQLITAALLLIPRTALLGALMYFPIILNICILAYATRFEGTRITTLMLLANVYLICWDYHRIKYILPFKQHLTKSAAIGKSTLTNKFPGLFFGCVFLAAAAVIVVNHFLYDIRPGNSLIECTNGCKESAAPRACEQFCDCIHNRGETLNKCLAEYEKLQKR